MSIQVLLNVRDKKIKSTDINYDDLIILYNQYISDYGEVPTYSKCDSKHNMPQGRIITSILKENNITYNDFLLQFGKVKHVRTESKDYDLYVKKFKKKCEELGRYILQEELTNNTYGLPSSSWFVKYCPNDEVKSYYDFIKWCGYEVHYSITKEYVAEKMMSLEKQLNRPLIKKDIKYESIGFSLIVINRLYGTFSEAKKEIGLLETLPNQPKPFEVYKNKLDITLNTIYEKTNRKIISWKDIENKIYNVSDNYCEHKTLLKAFKDNDVNIYSYIKSKGFEMTQNDFSYTYIFEDGERVVSTMEFDFSSYLRRLGFEYNKTYFRDVPYKTFSNEKSKINCDYKILLKDKILYVEIAGIISETFKGKDWRVADFNHKRKQEYQKKMLKKEQIMNETKQNYLFIYDNQMHDLSYVKIFEDKIIELQEGGN